MVIIKCKYHYLSRLIRDAYCDIFFMVRQEQKKKSFSLYPKKKQHRVILRSQVHIKREIKIKHTLGGKNCIWPLLKKERKSRKCRARSVHFDDFAKPSSSLSTGTTRNPSETSPCGIFWRTMWHVGTLPSKFGDAIGVLLHYAHQSITIFFCPM